MNWRLDQEAGESWISQTFGLFKLKGMFSEFHDNLEEDPRRPRNTRMLGGSALSLSLPSKEFESAKARSWNQDRSSFAMSRQVHACSAIQRK
jgi:hypothetical protein